MKQHITEKQLDELNDQGWKSLNKYILGVDTPEHFYTRHQLLSIGQMIEFLDNYTDFNQVNKSLARWSVDNYVYGERREMSSRRELCDALWESVKIILSKQ